MGPKLQEHWGDVWNCLTRFLLGSFIEGNDDDDDDVAAAIGAARHGVARFTVLFIEGRYNKPCNQEQNKARTGPRHDVSFYIYIYKPPSAHYLILLKMVNCFKHTKKENYSNV